MYNLEVKQSYTAECLLQDIEQVFDTLGRFPVTGQLVALLRAPYGLAKAITCFALACIFVSDALLKETMDGLLHVGRACVEFCSPYYSKMLAEHDKTKWGHIIPGIEMIG